MLHGKSLASISMPDRASHSLLIETATNQIGSFQKVLDTVQSPRR